MAASRPARRTVSRSGLTAGAGPDERIIELVLLGESWRGRSRLLAEIVEGFAPDEDHRTPEGGG